MGIICESEGIAKEYAPFFLDLYENKNGEAKPVTNALENLVKDAADFKAKNDQQEILLGYKSDPFPDEEDILEINTEAEKIISENVTRDDNRDFTREAIKILKKNDLKFCVLTEKAENALQHLKLFKGYNKARYGTKLLSNENGNRLNLEDASIQFGIESLKEANKREIKTWVDLDPAFEPDMARKIVRELYQVVDQWKIDGNNFDIKPESKSDWNKFEKNSDGLLDFLGIGSPWTEGVIPTRKGKRNILVIAPHGHSSDDTGTYQLARQIADELDCYAVVNKKYRKPENLKAGEKYEEKYLVDLNYSSAIKNSKEAMTDFDGPIKEFKQQILKKHGSLFILHIHGIGNPNRKKVAELLKEFKDNPQDLHLLIGYGQHRTKKTEKKRITADLDKFVKPLMTELYEVSVKSAIAPTQCIIDKNGEQRWYCGNHPDRLNQKLCKPRNGVQSLQLEFKGGGFRDKSENIKEAALKISKAVDSVWKMDTPAAIQTLPGAAASTPDLDKVYNKLLEIVSEGFENTMYDAGRYLIKIFYVGDYKKAKEDKKRQSLNSLNQYILKLREQNPGAPGKSWIYNAVNLVIQRKTIEAHSDKLFHTYGKLPLSHKVLLFPVKDMSTKQRLIEYADQTHPTVIEFKRKKAELKSNDSRKTDSNPSLLKIIANPEKIFTDEMSNLLTTEALIELPSSKLEKLQARIAECVSNIEGEIKIQKEYLTRYKEMTYTLEKVAKDKAVKARVKAQPELKTVTPVIISASRATDIPAFHSEWFFNRLSEDYCLWKNPYGGGKDRVSFKSTRLIVFWTKNPKPILPRLKELDEHGEHGLNYYFLYTLNDYEVENLEPNLPALEHRIETFKRLSDTIGKKRVIWRFDPLVLTDQITKEQLVEKVYSIGNRLKGFTEKLVVSFAKVEQHKKVKNNLKKEGINHLDFTETDINYVANQLAQLGNDLGIIVGACAEDYDLTKFGIERNKCIDDEFIKNVFSNDPDLMDYIGNGGSRKHQGQRKFCGCIVSKDIGAYDTCKYFCKYCYATVSEKAVNNNFEDKINPNNESLLGD